MLIARLLAIVSLIAFSALGTACSSTTVVYHEVPEWQLREGYVSNYTDADGVKHVYTARNVGAIASYDPDDPGAAFGQATDEHGNPKFHALMPEQVLGAVLQALVDEEYELLWEQVLASRIRNEYETSGGGYEGFADYFSRNRDDLFAALNRMSADFRSPTVLHEPGPYGGQRFRFHPHFAKEYRFSAVDMVWENNGLKLMMIHPTFGE